MPSLGSRGDTPLSEKQRKRRGALQNALIGPRFRPLPNDPDIPDAHRQQALNAVPDVFFGGVVGPAGAERIVGRELPSVGQQLQNDFDIYHGLEKEGLLPSQVQVDSYAKFDADNINFFQRHLDRFVEHGGSDVNFPALSGARVRPGTALGVALSGIYDTDAVLPNAQSPGPHGRPFVDLSGPIRSRGVLSEGEVNAFFQSPDFLSKPVAERQALVQQREESLRISGELPYFPPGTTVDEAIQIQERRSNQERLSGNSTGPLFYPNSRPGQTYNNTPTATGPGRSIEGNSFTGIRGAEIKLGGPNQEEDQRIQGLLNTIPGNPREREVLRQRVTDEEMRRQRPNTPNGFRLNFSTD